MLARFPHADGTHRQRSDAPRTHEFRLQDPDTWCHPPLGGRSVVWTFPAAPVGLVQRFHEAMLAQVSALIVLGSTSAYRLPPSGEPAEATATVDESSPLDTDQPRVAAEEWLRTRGATILQLAGIFGPGRDPAAWLQAGRIRDGAKIVNLVHVDDVVHVIAHVLAHPLPGQRINVGNGEPVAWRTLAATMKRQGRVAQDLPLAGSGSQTHGKRVDVRRLQALLPGHAFRRP
ncbi:MAG: hypothetical protein KY442_12500 [Proteobacteria bacterium]|nr:hypothetical protein [Pseudomonadota bacterium]